MFLRKLKITAFCLLLTSWQASGPKENVLMDLLKKPCSVSDVTATEHLTNPLRYKIHACDGDTDTFYHSQWVEGVNSSPFFTLLLGDTFHIKTITVVNVHTGNYCTDNPVDCTERINGAKVEVLADDVVIEDCGRIIVTSNTLTAEAQTYPIDCGDGAEGNKVRVQLEDTEEPLLIAEISVTGYKPLDHYSS